MYWCNVISEEKKPPLHRIFQVDKFSPSKLMLLPSEKNTVKINVCKSMFHVFQFLAVVYDAFLKIEKDKLRKLLVHRRLACQFAFKLLVSREVSITTCDSVVTRSLSITETSLTKVNVLAKNRIG